MYVRVAIGLLYNNIWFRCWGVALGVWGFGCGVGSTGFRQACAF